MGAAREPILVKGARLVLVEAGGRVLEGASILVEDGRIAYVGWEPPSGAKSGLVVDASSLVAVPCTYNAHTHAAMAAMRGLWEEAELHEWLRRMWFLERRLTARIVYEAARVAAAEMLLHGTCGFMDMYFYAEETARAAAELGLRVRAGDPVMGRVDAARAVEAAARQARRLESDPNPLVGGVIGVHSVYAAPLDAIGLAASTAAELNVPMHIHASETRREVYEAKRRYGRFPVELIASLGGLGERTVLVHCGWIASWELRLVAEAGSSIVHCPSSNMKLATAGHMPLREAIDMGINVAIGTDGPATGGRLSVLGEARTALLLQRHSYWDARVKPSHVLAAATTGSARAMMLPSGAGTIRVGAPGDLVLLPAYAPQLQPLSRETLEANLVMASPLEAEYVVVGGVVRLSPELRGKVLASAFESARRVAEWLKGLQVGEETEPPCSPREACT